MSIISHSEECPKPIEGLSHFDENACHECGCEESTVTEHTTNEYELVGIEANCRNCDAELFAIYH